MQKNVQPWSSTWDPHCSSFGEDAYVEQRRWYSMSSITPWERWGGGE